ncbi:hypothetical protein ACFLZ7_01225 [Nanoarchaeota archaeon]
MYLEKAKEALNLIKKRPFVLPIIVLVDLLFLVSYGFSRSIIQRKLAPFLQVIIDLSSKVTSSATELFNAGGDPLQMILSDPTFTTSVVSIAKIFLVFALSIYLLWTLLQGSGWSMANKFIDKKIKLFSYVSKFALVNLFWFGLASLVIFGFMRFTLYNLFSLNNSVSAAIPNWVSIVANAIIIYFVFISIALVTKLDFLENIKTTFRVGFKKFPKIITTYALIIAVIATLNLFISFLMKTSLSLGIGVGIVMVIPMLTYSRIYFMLIIEKVIKEKN